MPIHLHIGTHKTGTTAIQQVLRQQRKALADVGVWYPNEAELLDGGSSKQIPHLNLARSLQNPKRKNSYSPTQVRQIVRRIVRGSRRYSHTIISAEPFWHLGFSGVRKGLSTEQLWAGKAAAIDQLRDLFGAADVKVTAVLRERSSYIMSFYSEWVTASEYEGSIQSFLRHHRHYWDYCGQLEAWAHHFPVNAHGYEALCQQGALPQLFLQRLCGSSIPQELLSALQPTWSNSSDPVALVVLKRFLNRLPLEHQQRLKIYRRYRRRLLKRRKQKQVQRLLTCNSWLSPKDLLALRRDLAAGDQQIRERFCPELHSKPTEGWERWRLAAQGTHAFGKAEEERLLGWVLSRWPPQSKWFEEMAASP
jgi:hypothetical protein